MSKKTLSPVPTAAEVRAPRTSAAAACAAVTLTVVMALGVWQVIAAVRRGLEFPQSFSDFREGRMTGAIEKQIDQKLPARSFLIAVANSLRYKLTRGAGEQVRLGQHGWLFLTDELRYYPDADASQAARIALLAKTAKLLEAKGIKLLVALVPDKARIYPQYLEAGHLPRYTEGRYAQALAALRANGVLTSDLTAPLTENAAISSHYYRTDTHWNNVGAQLAAQAIATTLKSANSAETPLLEVTSFATQPAGPVAERPGDLLKLMGLSDVPNFWRPRPDHEVPVATQQTSEDKGGGGLLGDTTAMPVTLVGTSYSLRGNFHGYLQQALSAKVLNTAKDGGGFLQAATEYFKDEAFKTAKPQVVVWELPERFLSAPLTDEAGWLAQVGLK